MCTACITRIKTGTNLGILMWQMASAPGLHFLFDVIYDAKWPYMYPKNSILLLDLYEIQVVTAPSLFVNTKYTAMFMYIF